MTALFFGDSQSPLFGVLSQPEDGSERSHGVVLCPPIGQEHIRAHWALRQTSSALTRAGFHTLRFDWFGVGDSAGNLSDASIARWRADLENAIQELRDGTGVRDVSIVGLRLGATIAMLAAEDLRYSAMVLWDPVPSGRDYIASLRALTARLLVDPVRYWNAEPSRRARPSELVGFDFGEALLRELGEVDVSAAELPQRPLCLLQSFREDAVTALGTRLRDDHPDLEAQTSEVEVSWTDPEAIEELFLPGDALRLLTSFLERHAS